ncbi:hypothetical protein MRB53_017016 [Persea americana]|uniref:Uncharacterized protein n=1 Tax=Persea americana TaxID=3435 RepID=A0ACC2M578_PERAE|nr:hypothetical protein MRB53_017016 [Persea americana]
MVMIGETHDGRRCHGEQYLSWYRQATRKSSTTPEAVPQPRVEKALAKVDLFLQFGARSITLMSREQRADVQYEQSMRLGQKMQEFREAIKSLEGLEEFNLQACINDQVSNGSATGSSSSEWSVEEVLKSAFSTKLGKKECADITVRLRTPTNRTASRSLPSVNPCKSKAGEEHDTEARREGSREDEAVPPFLTLYPPSWSKGTAQPNREYQLSTKECSLLEKFWIEYHTTPDRILEACGYISTQDLYPVLRRHWISTTIMDYWLSTNVERVHEVRIFPSTLAATMFNGIPCEIVDGAMHVELHSISVTLTKWTSLMHFSSRFGINPISTY